jgi:hypothetical protein
VKRILSCLLYFTVAGVLVVLMCRVNVHHTISLPRIQSVVWAFANDLLSTDDLGHRTLENALKSKGISKEFDEWVVIAKVGRSGDS